jgi:hypothetical protein
MTPPTPLPDLRRQLSAAHGRVRRALITRHALRAASIAAVGLSVAVAAGLILPVRPVTAWLRLLGAGAIGIAGLAGALAAFRRQRPRFDTWVERIEQRFPEVRSWLRNALDLEARPPAHASCELGAALVEETRRRLQAVPLPTLTPRVEPARPLLAMGAVLGILAVLGTLAPGPTARSWATLWSPGAAAPPVRLEVEPGSVRVSPGAALAVRARVWGTAAAPRLVRDGDPAPPATPEGAGTRGERVWRFDLTQLTREQEYRVRAASVLSPRYRIALAGEPQAVSFEIEYQAPAYARLGVQKGTATRGDVAALRGSRARIEALFDRDLLGLDAALPGGAVMRWTPISPRRWRGEILIEREGEYALTAVAAGGRSRFAYRIQPLPDAPPVLAVRSPEGDLDLPAGQRIPIEILGQDDLGLASLALQYRRDADAAWVTVPLARFPGGPREAGVTHDWDASGLSLLPGESGSFRLVLEDGNVVSGPGRAVSPVFQVRFPKLSELYARMEDRQAGAQKSLEKVAEQAREMQKTLDKLNRDMRPSPTESHAFEKSEELKSALERQQELSRQVEQSARQVRESLEMAAERKAYDDRIMRKLQEITQLMRQIESKELREAVQRLQEALQKMDRHEMAQALPQWRQEAQQMLQNLERTAELLKQLRQEERLESLARRAEELKAQQDALNQEMQARAEERRGNEGERQALAGRQNKAAEETKALAQETREAAGDLDQPKETAALDQAAEELEHQAAEEQQQASDAARTQPSQGAPHGERASQSLARAAKSMRDMLAQRQQEREGVDLAALRRAAQDLVSIQREAEENMDSGAPMNQRADRGEDLSEGVSRVTDSLQTLSKRTPFISPQLSQSLGKAMSQLGQSAQQFDQGSRQAGEAVGRGAAQSLNEAILQLRDTEASMCQNPGNSPGRKNPGRTGQTMERVTEQQTRLNQQSQRLSKRLTEQMRMSSEDGAELQRLSDEQARIREQLAQAQRDDQAERKLLGRLDQAQREMKDVEERLRKGEVGGETEQKQIQILSRLLDAQRSLNRQDFDPQRESRPGGDVVRESPPELPADLLKPVDRLRLDLLKAEADRYPAQYRAFIEAYLRSLNGSRR